MVLKRWFNQLLHLSHTAPNASPKSITKLFKKILNSSFCLKHLRKSYFYLLYILRLLLLSSFCSYFSLWRDATVTIASDHNVVLMHILLSTGVIISHLHSLAFLHFGRPLSYLISMLIPHPENLSHSCMSYKLTSSMLQVY